MAITADYVRQVFKGLEDGDGAEFFKYVVHIGFAPLWVDFTNAIRLTKKR
jgi:hypothetical protein